MNDPFPDRLIFAEPAVFWMLTIALPLIFLKVATDRRAGQAVRRFIAPGLRKRLAPRARLFPWAVFGLRLLGLSLFIVALARPQMGEITEEVETEGRSLLLAIDTSKSMLARDLKPDRLTRAKLAAQDLVEGLGGDRIGLISFAGRPFLQAPLTIDHGAIIDFLGRLDTDSAPRGGSNLAEAIALALDTFDKDQGGSHALIVFSDGDELEGSAVVLAEKAKEKNIVIITIGTGTRAGEIIPDPDPAKRGEFIKDETGKIVRTQLQPESLQTVARITGGIYIDLGATTLSADAIGETLEKIESRTFEATEETRRIERYKIPLAAGMICFLGSFLLRLFSPSRQAPVVARAAAAGFARASVIALTSSLILIGFTGNSHAESGAAVADPKALFDAGEFDGATEAYRHLADEAADAKDQAERRGQLSRYFSNWFKKRPATDPTEAAQWRYGAGASAYRAKDFETAERAFSDALQDEDREIRSRAHHGLAGTLYHRGESIQETEKEKAIALWKEALEHYDETIKLDPENIVAPKNAAYIRHLLEQHEQQQNQKPEPSESEEKPEDGEGEKEENPSDKKEEPGENGGDEKENPEENPEGQEGEGDPKEGEGQGEEEEPEEGEEPEGEEGENNEEKTPAEMALEAARRYADEDGGVDFKPKAFRSRGFKDW